jgi:hypothetical protein
MEAGDGKGSGRGERRADIEELRPSFDISDDVKI